MYNYDLSQLAKQDLLCVYEYGINPFGVDQADKYFELMHDCFSKIAKNPYMFPIDTTIKSNYHKYVCGVEAIYFKVETDGVLIVTIIGRQDFEMHHLVH